MNNTALQNVKLVGTTSAAGGTFSNVHVTGEVVFRGDVECQQLRGVGTTRVKGNLKAGIVKLTGECKVEGNMQVTHMNGVGQIDVSGGIRGEIIKLSGELAARGNCEAEDVLVRGVLRVNGLVSADKLDIKLHGPSEVREIGGGLIQIRRSRSLFMKRLFKDQPGNKLSTQFIEGDSIRLEHTRADIVRGNRVTIGPGCDIGLVEYRKELQVSKKAVVKEQKQIR